MPEDTQQRVELTISPSHKNLDFDDDRFDVHISDLIAALNEDVGSITVRDIPVEGQRGGSAEIILALGTSGALGAAVAVIRAWLDRDKARNIRINISEQGDRRGICIEADSARMAELDTLVGKVLK